MTTIARIDGGSMPSRSLRAWIQAAAIVVVGMIPMVLWRYRWRVPIDLAVYRAGGSAVIHAKTLYGPGFGDHTLPIRLPFTYPPFSAIAFLTLFVLPWAVSMIGWFLLSLGSLAYIVKESFAPFLARIRRSNRVAVTACIVAVLLWTVPVTDTLWFGQINLILAALVMTDCLHPRRHQGILVGLATAVKITPGLFIVYLAMLKKRGAAARAIATVGACWGVAAIILPGKTRQYWFHTAFNVSRPGPPAFFSNQTINGLIHRLNGPTWLWLPLSVCIAGLGLWRARNVYRAGNQMAGIALVGVTTLLVAPISWLASAVWIVPAIGVLLDQGRERRRVLTAGTLLVLFLARLPMLGDKIVRVYRTPVIGSIVENAYVIMLGVLILTLGRQKATRGTNEHGEATVPAESIRA